MRKLELVGYTFLEEEVNRQKKRLKGVGWVPLIFAG